MCLLTETRALSAQGEKRALVGNLTMPLGEPEIQRAAAQRTTAFIELEAPDASALDSV